MPRSLATKPTTQKAAPKKRAVTRAPAKRKAANKDPEFYNGWVPRPHQAPKFEAIDKGTRYHFYAWHRRAGKDAFALNLASVQLRKRVGTYWHLFPLHVQARRAIWKGMDKNGFKFLDQAFPDFIRHKTYETDMLIEFTNGSTWQLAGSDYYDRLVGANVVGVVFSEWALCDPRAWTYVSPIIRENKGYACFITTFRGRNHAWQMFQRVKDNPEWSAELLTIEDTGLLTEEDIQAERDNGMSEALIQQEYYCDPLASADGAVYGSTMGRLVKSRAGDIAFLPSLPVRAAWSFDQYPINISVVLAQGDTIVGSVSYMFEEFQAVYADLVHSFPFPIAEHIVHAKSDKDASIGLFADAGIYPQVIIESDQRKIIRDTTNFLATAKIDTAKRPWAPQGNNVVLVDSLNGYQAQEKDYNTWSLSTSAMSEHDYMTHAVEAYALWYTRQGNTGQRWGKAPDYSIQDRAII